MKKYIQKAIGLSIIALLLITTSCSDLFDQEPQGEWTENDNPGGALEAEVFTLYAKVRSFAVTSGNTAQAIHNFRSEDAEKGSTASDGSEAAAMYDDFQYNASDGMLKSYYSDNYAMIHVANNIIDDLAQKEKTEALSDGDIINRGEAHFFRAFNYFNLVRAFGEVPFIDYRLSGSVEAILPKSPASKIYELIDNDLKIAEESLPRVWEQRYLGRLTWGAARSLHAKTYMMRNDWNNMYIAATEVINSKIYSLDPDFANIFRETGENGSGSIFELQCLATASLPGSNEIGSQFAQVQGVKGSGDWNLGWGMHTPTQLLADAFEAGDPRKDETLLYFYRSQAEADAPGAIANKPWGEKPVAQSDVINKYYNKKAYTNPAIRAQFTKSGFWVNIRMIRLADVILMAAESANELGKTDEALGFLEDIRKRARGTNASVLPKVTTTDQITLRNAIRFERRIELAMEWDRFYDLVRWGIAKQVLHAAGKTAYQDRNALLPLPQSEIDNSNGILVQNPNY